MFCSLYMGTKQGIDQVMPSGYRFVPTDQETKQGIDQVMPSWYRFEPTDQETKQGIDQVMPAGYRFVPTDQELVFHYLIKRSLASLFLLNSYRRWMQSLFIVSHQ